MLLMTAAALWHEDAVPKQDLENNWEVENESEMVVGSGIACCSQGWDGKNMGTFPTSQNVFTGVCNHLLSGRRLKQMVTQQVLCL